MCSRFWSAMSHFMGLISLDGQPALYQSVLVIRDGIRWQSEDKPASTSQDLQCSFHLPPLLQNETPKKTQIQSLLGASQKSHIFI